MNKKAHAILVELSKGRKLTRKGTATPQWEDGVHKPPLTNPTTSLLFRAGFITPEYKAEKLHLKENLTGYIVLSALGKTFVKR